MIPKWYGEIFERYSSILNQYDHLYIGLSAGIDSNMLLHWLHTYRKQLPPITAIHVNHQWHGEDSFTWANFAKNSAQRYGFDFINYDVLIDIDQKGAEACGREARYIKFAETMQDNDLLVVAHHRSDQAETIMYRLLRGSGTLGLGGMRDLTVLKFGEHELSVCRPLLSISKSQLYDAGKILGIPWMEDYTNHGVEEARNQIRNAIFPMVAEYFPHYEQTFARSAQLIQENDQLALEIAETDYSVIAVNQSNDQLDLAKLRQLSSVRQKNVLRYWFALHDVILEKRQFDEFLAGFIDKIASSKSCFSKDHWSVRAFKDRLYFFDQPLNLTGKVLGYSFTESCNAPSLEFWENLSLELILRENGMVFQPVWRGKSQTVKKLLQELEVVPWLRSSMHALRDRSSGDIVWCEYLGLAHKFKEHCQENGILPSIIRNNTES